MNSYSVDELLSQATCAVLIDGEIAGTAWLVSDEGHLLTAGHMLGMNLEKSDINTIQVQFSGERPLSVRKVSSSFNREAGIDYAVLKLENPPDNRHALPISLARSVEGRFRLYGYGTSLVSKTGGIGEFVALHGSDNNRLFRLRSRELAEVGFSGGAVYSDNLKAVVAIFVEAGKSRIGPTSETVLAMPLYRIAELWPPLTQFAKILDTDHPASASNTDSKLTDSSRNLQPTATESIEISAHAGGDSPIQTLDADLLGFQVYALALSDFIKNQHTTKPLTIAIDAPWGMGKSSLMNMIKDELSHSTASNQPFLAVWFNAWKHDREDFLWAALICEILRQVRNQLSWWEQVKLSWSLNWERFEKGLLIQNVLRSIWFIGIIALAAYVIFYLLTPFFPLVSEQKIADLRDFGELLVAVIAIVTLIYTVITSFHARIAAPFDLNISKYFRQADYQKRVSFFAQFEEDYKNVLNIVTKDGRKPLVIFIDDLDRCSPIKSVEIIESINLLLDSKHCVFILGMDTRTVASNIEAKYRDLADHLKESDNGNPIALGQRFLEKIVQIHFRIPTADPDTMMSFITSTLAIDSKSRNEMLEPPNSESINEERNSARSTTSERNNGSVTRNQDARTRQDVFIKSFDKDEQIRQAIGEAAKYLKYNPRKVKRFINLFRLQAFIANRQFLIEDKTIRLDVLAKWLIIGTRWPNLELADHDLIEKLVNASQIEQELANGTTLDRERDQKRLEDILADEQVVELIKEKELTELLQSIVNSDGGMSETYMRLSQIINIR